MTRCCVYASLLFAAGCGGDAVVEGRDPHGLEFEVSVPATLAECAASSECMIVEPRCSNCCGAAAIAKDSEQAFREHRISEVIITANAYRITVLEKLAADLAERGTRPDVAARRCALLDCLAE